MVCATASVPPVLIRYKCACACNLNVLSFGWDFVFGFRMVADLRQRLKNWGYWLEYEADIGPSSVKCESPESQYMAEAGDLFSDEPTPSQITPDVSDAEGMQSMIRQLTRIEEYALAVVYAGYPSVFRQVRLGDHAIHHLCTNAETLLAEMLINRPPSPFLVLSLPSVALERPNR